MLNLFQPSLADEELAAVREVFESNWVGKGKVTDRFESRFAEFQGVDRCSMRSVTCCTEGLFQAIRLLEIGPGDEVVLPTISFVGAANAVAASGAKPVFCDVDRRSLNTTAAMIDEKLCNKTKAIVLLHYGFPCAMDEICELVAQRGITLIEDAATAVASRHRGQACGTFGTIGVWSFDAMKALVTGDGGMVFSSSEQIIQRLEKEVYLGLVQGSGFDNRDASNWWEFDICTFGRRAIMNDIASAIGIEQLKKLPGYTARRQQIHDQYNDVLGDVNWLQTPPEAPPYVDSSYYFYWIQTQPGIRDRLARYLRDNEIYTSFRYYPLHLVKHYGQSAKLKHAEEAANTTLCLPIHQSLSDADVDRITTCIRRFAA